MWMNVKYFFRDNFMVLDVQITILMYVCMYVNVCMNVCKLLSEDHHVRVCVRIYIMLWKSTCNRMCLCATAWVYVQPHLYVCNYDGRRLYACMHVKMFLCVSHDHTGWYICVSVYPCICVVCIHVNFHGSVNITAWPCLSVRMGSCMHLCMYMLHVSVHFFVGRMNVMPVYACGQYLCLALQWSLK
jgi:hypothetical protein